MTRGGWGRVALLTALVLAAGALTVGYTRYVVRRDADLRSGPAAATADPASAAALQQVLAGSYLAFRSTTPGPGYGRLAVVPLADPTATPVRSTLSCERVYAARSAAVCLTADRGVVTTYRARLLGSDLAVGREIPLPGLPSRARVAADGQQVAWTTFVAGDSYAAANFSTRTNIVDVSGGTPVDVETYTVVKGGAPYRSPDINVWGVTFAGGGRFYATVGSQGQRWLVAGDQTRRELRVVAEGVECPSLSPDGTRVAYKRATGPGRWAVHVRELASGTDRRLAETRSVDDQVEWLDNSTVLYGLPRPGTGESDVWALPADGTGAPRVFLADAWSPAVVRR